MSDNTILKADKDFTKDTDKLIPEAETLAQSNLQAAIDKLLVLEKQTRQVRWLMLRPRESALTYVHLGIRPRLHITHYHFHRHVM